MQHTPQWHLPFLFFPQARLTNHSVGSRQQQKHKVSHRSYTTEPMFSKTHLMLYVHRFIQQKVGHAVELLAKMFPEI